MKSETYAALLKDLQKLQKTLVASQIAAVRRNPALSTHLARLHAEAEVGGRFDDFVATAARKSTVLFLLRTVFVRVLEDLGILGVKRIRGDWGFAAFREVAPALGHRAYFAFVFRDLAIDFPALFASGEDELPLPDEDGCVDVWELWHHPNREGAHYVWNGDGFDSRFLGDLYQDLDKDIRKRYALLQTPRFVEKYILDYTLTPAIEQFDPATLRAKGEAFRVIDPTCGSGHFLIGAFHRLADYWRDRHGLSEWNACERALENVWGADINPHAIDIAAFRLLLEVVARTGVRDLNKLASLSLNLRTMDSLIPWERSSRRQGLFAGKDLLEAYGPPAQRKANADFLSRDFHSVVGNPPYIQPKDAAKADAYRAFWPDSCFKEFCLNAPFLERFLTIGTAGAFTGQITANNFAKRAFGKSVITKVLSRWCTTAVVDTSLAPIPGHGWKGGTSTVVIFGRSIPFKEGSIPWILAKRRESAEFTDPASSLAWKAIESADWNVQQSGTYVEVQHRGAESAAVWPWDLRGREGQEIVEAMEQSTDLQLAAICKGRIGSDVITRAPELFEWEAGEGMRFGLPTRLLQPFADGKDIRDWHAAYPKQLLVPYQDKQPVEGAEREAVTKSLWKWRRGLESRFISGGVTLADRGLPFFVIPQVPWHKHSKPRAIVFPFVTTEPHFVFAENHAWFKHSVTLIKLREDLPRDEWLFVTGVLNTSAASYWLRGKFKGTGRVRELWDDWLQIDEKLSGFPIPRVSHSKIATLADALLSNAQMRASCLPASVIASCQSFDLLADNLAQARAEHERITRVMVALQEELDWAAYDAYGLAESPMILTAEEVEELAPGHRPFEILLARQDECAPSNEKTAWFARLGHERTVDIPAHYSDQHRARLQERMTMIEVDPTIRNLELPAYKRKWQGLDWNAEVVAAAEGWLLDRIEELFFCQDGPPPLDAPRPYRLDDIVATLSRDSRPEIVASLWAGTKAGVDLPSVVEKMLLKNAVPDNPHRLFSSEGLRKQEEWKAVWELQDSPSDDSSIPKPAAFKKSDFARSEFYTMRGSLNVPRERFVLFADLSPPRFGWNGWHGRDRALAQVEAFSLAESDPQQPLPVPTTDDPRRCGVTMGLWESLHDVKRWASADEYTELQSLAQEACRQSKCPCPVVEAWSSTVLPGGPAGDAALVVLSTKGKGACKSNGLSEPETSPTASLPERAWIARLLESGKEVDAAGLWALHRRRIEEAEATVGEVPIDGQLRLADVDDSVPPHARAIDEARLAIVIDDLVASGDLSVRGRGKKRRYQLVPRGTRA